MNLTRFLPYMKHTLLVVAMLTIVGISGCDDDDGPKIFSGTIMAYISGDEFKQANNGDETKSLDSLVKFLNYHGLNTALEVAGPITLFAPNNAAFKNLIATPGFPADIRKIDPNLVKGVLSYHIVPGAVMKKDIKEGASFTTAFTGTVNNPNDKINVNADGTLLTGSTNKAIQILQYDKQATNGVVQIAATVLIPQTVGESLTPILGTLAGSVFLGADFTTLVKMINNADVGVGAADQIRTLLATPPLTETSSNLRRTFFAIPNAYFTAAAAQQGVTVDQLVASFGTGATSAARFILLNHMITTNTANRTTYTVSNIEGSGDVQFANGVAVSTPTNAGKTITAATGLPPSQSVPLGIALSAPKTAGGTSQIGIAVKDITHSNGSVLHVVLGFLIP